MGDLSKNFSSAEMKCKCGCGICNVSSEFIKKLQAARTVAMVQFTIVSGCRCPDHNYRVGGKDTSDHVATEGMQCAGADIQCYDSISRLRIISAAIIAGFTRIGIANSFIHLGMREGNPENVMWVY